MAENFILAVLTLVIALGVNALVFWFLIGKKLTLRQVVRFVSVAQAANRLFFSGLGYAAMSLKMKKDGISFPRAVSSFALFEFCSVAPLLLLGLFFGAKIAFKIPFFFALAGVLCCIFVAVKRRKAIQLVKDTYVCVKESKKNIGIVITLMLVNIAPRIYYYLFLFKGLGINLSIFETLKLATVPFAVGYLSPAPSGLGFKEAGMVFLLTQYGIAYKQSLPAVLIDRIMTSVFYVIIGFSCGADIMRGWLKGRRDNKLNVTQEG